jgi:hypothetical protein
MQTIDLPGKALTMNSSIEIEKIFQERHLATEGIINNDVDAPEVVHLSKIIG